MKEDKRHIKTKSKALRANISSQTQNPPKPIRPPQYASPRTPWSPGWRLSSTGTSGLNPSQLLHKAREANRGDPKHFFHKAHQHPSNGPFSPPLLFYQLREHRYRNGKATVLTTESCSPCTIQTGGIASTRSTIFMASSRSSFHHPSHLGRYPCCSTQVKNSHISTGSPLVLTAPGSIHLTYSRRIASALHDGGGRFPRISLVPRDPIVRDVVVQGPRDGDDEIDARKAREEERGLHGEVGARGGAGGEGGEGIVEPTPEGLDVGEDVGCVGLGEEAV